MTGEMGDTMEAHEGPREFRHDDRVIVVGAADYNGLTGEVAWVDDGRVGVWIDGGDLTTFLASEIVHA